ncbi:1-acyl-sn-glycerol-3-phosphate acyltransferase [Pedobacter sp. SYSU D00535]|uniref:lysophospholipid acyltransferase family protein n=1 Tax=Pedobacter sp. SYSU D00535 TaxID=2810308 RepID=UPI001A961516|nr:lysophospholipid acyltransferase family protein [Pedobacter sp. SYSU D00535]
MNKLLGYFFTPLHYFFYVLCLLIFHPLQWLALKLGGYSAHKKVVDILNFFLVSTFYLAGTRVIFKNEYQLPESRSIIFVANHQSMFDIPPLIWFLRKYHAKFISKIELTKGIPSVSFNLKYGGGANIDRKDPKQSIMELMKLGQRMKDNNWSAVIFPEGTRSKTGVLKPFNTAGVATLLKKAPEALIVPIAIENSWKIVQYGKFPLSFGEKMILTVLSPIETEGRKADEILKEAELLLRRHLKQELPEQAASAV